MRLLLYTLLPGVVTYWRVNALAGAPSVEIRSTSTSVPSPISIAASEWFDGVDGKWSTMNIRVGTPSQNMRVLVSTASQDTMVVLPLGCSSAAFTDGDVPSNCASGRGETFAYNGSSTWESMGYYSINEATAGFESNLGYSLTALYGTDNISLGYVDGPTLTNQTVVAFAKIKPFYMGTFGLGTQPVNYTDLGNFSTPSYFMTLKSQNLIPSLSWSFTAGAKYQNKYMQLIFGGEDTSRYRANSVEFAMSEDITRDLVVTIQLIEFSGTTQSSLLTTPITAFVDSTDPNIWLPADACRAFEDAFGISIDNNTGLYLMNDTQYYSLSSSNPTVSFRLAELSSGGTFVDITLPFLAFAQEASYPFVPNSTYYFPLRQAENSTQYTLGRTFLQEAYLTADYGRSTFRISQCVFEAGATENITTIYSTDQSTTSGTTSPTSTSTSGSNSTTSSSSTISGGAIAGIVVACVVAIGAAGLLYFFLRRRQQKALNKQTNVDSTPTAGAARHRSLDQMLFSEMDDSKVDVSKTKVELNGDETQMVQMLDGQNISVAERDALAAKGSTLHARAPNAEESRFELE
ncbi:hypothetical protein BP6252_05854 [Coleophoma cylindrospora]|uniref:Peptidase A1 domain-containing protein n=1 Tax=Coleophoma cylindrospora TaxID=1849047 RepID=A0A3D8RVH0_9HELO|nr:hypothetical protein BP6252_05854 [Coleophoma cylindrospora]